MNEKYEKPDMQLIIFDENSICYTLGVSNGEGSEGTDFDNWIEGGI